MEPVALAFVCGVAFGFGALPAIMYAVESGVRWYADREWNKRIMRQRFEAVLKDRFE